MAAAWVLSGFATEFARWVAVAHAVIFPVYKSVVRDRMERPILVLAEGAARKLAPKAHPDFWRLASPKRPPLFQCHEAELLHRKLSIASLARKFSLPASLLLFDHAAHTLGFAHASISAPERERVLIKVVLWPAPLTGAVAKEKLVQGGFVSTSANTGITRDGLGARSGPEFHHVWREVFSAPDDTTIIA